LWEVNGPPTPPFVGGGAFLWITVDFRHESAIHDLMGTKPKLILCLALVLSGGLALIRLGAEDTARFPIVDIGTNYEIKVGYIDASGKIAIPLNTNWWPTRDARQYFLEGLEPTQIRGKVGRMTGDWGYIDTQGKFVVEPQFSSAQPFSEGLAAVRDASGRYGNKCGYIDHTGKYVITPQFDEAFAFSEGFACVEVSNLFGYIDKRGASIIEPQYRSGATRGFAEGLVWVEVDGKWGCVNEKGETVIGFKFTEPSYFSEGLAAVTVADSDAPPDFPGSTGYIDKTGALVIAPQFSPAWNFSGGLARVEVREKMIYINKQGKTVFTIPNGSVAGEFSEGLANVSIRTNYGTEYGAETWGYINRKGDFVIKPQFQKAEPFYQGLAHVFLNGQSGYIDKSGRFVWRGKTNPLLQPVTVIRQTNEAERIENNREIFRLAKLIDPTNPPVTDQMLETGEFDERLFNLGHSESKFTFFLSSAPESTHALLMRLLRYSLPARSQDGSGDDSIRVNAAQLLIDEASPAVVPILREWLKQGLAAAEAGKPCRWGELDEAVRGLDRCHDETIVPLLVTAWERGVFENELPDMNFRRMRVISTFAEMPSPISKQILLKTMTDKQLNEWERYPVAAALVRLDDQSAREVLLDGLDRYLAPDQETAESSRHVFAKYELERLGDAKLIAAIEAKAATATRKRPKLVMTELIARMRINNLPMEELKRIAVEEKDLNRRIPAVAILGATGGSDMLPFLESLAQHTNEYRGKSQNKYFAGVVKAAIGNSRLHNWRQSKETP
jgi:hypothetical protein